MIASISHAPLLQRRNEPKTRPADIGNDKSHRGKRKQDARDTDAGETSTLDRILRSPNDVKSEVGGFRKLLREHGFTPEDPTPSTKQRQYAAAGKENGQEPKPRFQRQEKCAAAATKAKTKGKTSRQAQPFVPVKQDLSSDCESEDDECANMASVKKAPPRVDYRAMNAQFCDDMQYGGWNKSQSANEDEVRFSALASICPSLLEASSALARLQAFL